MASSPYGEGGTHPSDPDSDISEHVDYFQISDQNEPEYNNTSVINRNHANLDESERDGYSLGSADRTSPPVVRNTDKADVFNLQKLYLYNADTFHVYVEKSNQQNIGKIHPMVIGHILLKKLNIKNIVSINKVGLNRVKVHVKSAFDANSIVNNLGLQKENLRAFIPTTLLYRKGVIRSVDTFFDEKYLLDNIESRSQIVEIKRLKRRTVIDGNVIHKATQSIAINFEGNNLPAHVIINGVFCRVEPFVYNVMQCFKCLRFGHVAKQCRSTNTLCANCGSSKTDEHTVQLNRNSVCHVKYLIIILLISHVQSILNKCKLKNVWLKIT